MKRVITMWMGVLLSAALFAQHAPVDYNAMEKQKRNRTLSMQVLDLLHEKFPDYWREDVLPVVWQCDFKGEGMMWEAGVCAHEPSYIAPSDTCYQVTLYYAEWQREGFVYPYIAKAAVIGRTGEIYSLTLGGRQQASFTWRELQGSPRSPKVEQRLSRLPAKERNELLIAIARRVAKQKLPNWPLDDFLPSVKQGDFSVLRLEKWLPRAYCVHVPDYVLPDDIYYRVDLMDTKWQERGGIAPFPARIFVYIAEKTGEVYYLDYEYDFSRPQMFEAKN